MDGTGMRIGFCSSDLPFVMKYSYEELRNLFTNDGKEKKIRPL